MIVSQYEISLYQVCLTKGKLSIDSNRHNSLTLKTSPISLSSLRPHRDESPIVGVALWPVDHSFSCLSLHSSTVSIWDKVLRLIPVGVGVLLSLSKKEKKTGHVSLEDKGPGPSSPGSRWDSFYLNLPWNPQDRSDEWCSGGCGRTYLGGLRRTGRNVETTRKQQINPELNQQSLRKDSRLLE